MGEHLLPKIKDHYSQNSGYANRVTTLHGLLQLSHAMTPEQVVSGVVPLLIKATKDSVPNVRFCACRTIEWIVDNHLLGAPCVQRDFARVARAAARSGHRCAVLRF